MASPEDCQLEDFSPIGAAALRFEAAADALVHGDAAGLRTLLEAAPELARERSPRAHRCTLLHYSAANGFEASRQRIPPNAVELVELLFGFGAAPDPTCEFGLGGPHTTPLISLVTSCWPYQAGVHAPLVDAFLAGGAAPDGLEDDGAPLDFALRFGYREAAAALVRGGARVFGSVQAAGLGRLAELRAALASGAEQKEIDAAFVTACRHGRLGCAEVLVERGADLAARGDQGFSALHSAAWYGELEVLEWLLGRGAPLEVLNDYGGTVLDGTVWGALNAPAYGVDYPPIIERLLAAGARTQAVSPFPTGNARIDALLRSETRPGNP